VRALKCSLAPLWQLQPHDRARSEAHEYTSGHLGSLEKEGLIALSEVNDTLERMTRFDTVGFAVPPGHECELVLPICEKASP